MADVSPPKKQALWNAVFQDLDRALAVCGLNGCEQIIMVRAREMSLTRARMRKVPRPLPFKINVSRLARKTEASRVVMSRALGWLVKTHVLDAIPGRAGVYRVNPKYRTWTGYHELTHRQLRFVEAVSVKTGPPKLPLDYEKYLLSREWQAKRELVLKRDDYKCRLCGSRRNLHVHHRTYDNIGNEPLEDLTTLCEDCHGMFHVHGKLCRR